MLLSELEKGAHMFSKGFEYIIVNISAHPAERPLNDLGKEGWELVSVILRGNEILAYLKRETLSVSPKESEQKANPSRPHP